MDTPENLEGVMRRIAKLLAIAGDSRANPAEAAAAAGMAEKVMRKYQLEHADVIAASLKAGEDMATEDCLATAKTNGTKVERLPPWANWMSVQIAKLHNTGVRQARSSTGEVVVRFFGFKSDVLVAAWTFNYLVATVNRLCMAFRKDPAYIIGGRSVMHSYRQGVSTGILGSIKKLIDEKEAEARTSSSGTALVVAKAQAIAERFGVTKLVKSGNIKKDNAFIHGFIHGKQVDVARRAVGGASTSSTLRLA